jgi:glycosyltransferase involved in cell wall biosynthesis
MPEIVREFPTFVYVVLGATHPHLIRQQGERYRSSLEDLARELGITDHVLFENRFVDLKELTEYIAAADVYVTPYLNPAQSVSGTLAYSFGCGKAVVSTPYWHAEELLADGRGVIVPFADSQAIAREVGGLLRDETRLNRMRRRAFELGREMIWPRVGEVYMSSFQEARRSRSQELAERLRGLSLRPAGTLASND